MLYERNDLEKESMCETVPCPLGLKDVKDSKRKIYIV